MLKVVDIKTDKAKYIEDATDVLKNAEEVGFEHVVVVGYKDEAIHIKNSAYMHRSKVIGALEIAKHHLLHGGSE